MSTEVETKEEPQDKDSKPAKRSKKRSTKKVHKVHVIEVFAAESKEYGWLYYSPKTPKELEEKLSKLEGKVGKNDYAPVTHEPEVNAWFIAEKAHITDDDVGKVGNDFEEILDAHFGEEWVFCPECAGREPCRVWNLKVIERHGFDVLEPDPWESTRRFIEEDVAGFVDTFLKHMLQSNQTTVQGMTVDAAAKILNVSWPLSKDDLERAFKAAAMKAHPDLGGDNQTMRTVILAREVLMKAMGTKK